MPERGLSLKPGAVMRYKGGALIAEFLRIWLEPYNVGVGDSFLELVHFSLSLMGVVDRAILDESTIRTSGPYLYGKYRVNEPF